MDKCHIYQIRNILNDHRYIGSSIEVDSRFRAHKKSLKKGNHHSIGLQRAWNKYGENYFIFETIKEVDAKDQIIEEQKEIDKYILGKNLYNSNPVAGLPPSFKGEDMYNAVVTNEQVKEIRKRYNEENDLTQYQLAEKYSVNQNLISNIVLNKTYVDENYIPKKSYDYKPQTIHKGWEHHNAKFTKEDIENIRNEYNEGNITLEKLGEKYNYDSVNLVDIIHNRTYVDENYIPKKSYKKYLVNQEIATKIREEYKNFNIKYSELGEKYGISTITVHDIVLNKTWKDDNYIYEKKKKSSNTKLNWDIINNIRNDYKSGLMIKDISIKHNTSKNNVDSIIKNKTWKDDNYIYEKQ